MTNPFTDGDRAPKARERAGRARYGWANKYLIEGEYVSFTEMAKRCHVETDTIIHRHARLCDEPGPITWEKLRKPLK